MENQFVTITGVFGDSWLSRLLPHNVGPSPAPYSFDGGIKLLSVNPDNSANVETYAPDDYCRTSYHTDGTRCGCYPCPHGKISLWYHIHEYKTRTARIPAGYWKMGGRPSSFREPSRTINGLDGRDITCPVTKPQSVILLDGKLTPISE
jgi:hypothetical protein